MADASPKKRFRWSRIVLVLSLALNLLVLGIVAGAVFHDGPGRDRRPEAKDLGFGPYVAALSKADRLALGLALRREDGPFLARRDEMREAFDAVLAALRAEPYDHTVVVDLINEQEMTVFATQQTARGLLLDYIGDMEPAARQAYADALERKRHWRGGPHGKRGD